FLAEHVKTIRLRCSSAYNMHLDMLSFAKQAYNVINRPPDNFCGPCPTQRPADEKTGRQAGPCETLLYDQEGEDKVKCECCRAEHDVEALRENLKTIVHDMLFTGSEILRLMETRLADKMSKSMLYKLIADGRLIARGQNGDGEWLFTYADIC